jgi:ferric-dicitrate binding protein FerR (iron transport regulator)
MTDLERLIDAYADDELSVEEEAAFCALLCERPENVDAFVRASFLHSELFSIARRQFMHEGVLRNTGAEALNASSRELRVHDPRVNARQPARSLRRHWLSAAAASVAALAAWGIWIVTRPPVVGQLTQAAPGAVWQHQSEVLKAGEFLYRGQRLQLVRGRALLTLGSGARVVLEGPARLHIIDDNRVQLVSGRVGATVPTQAIGFTIETASGDFVDLGTEFTLEVQSDGKCRLFVFTGMVEVRPRNSGRSSRPFQIPQTKGVAYDAATDVADPIPIGDEVRLAL